MGDGWPEGKHALFLTKYPETWSIYMLPNKMTGVRLNIPIVKYMVAAGVEHQARIVNCFNGLYPCIECFRHRGGFAESHIGRVHVLDAYHCWVWAYFLEEMFVNRERCVISRVHRAANHRTCVANEVT